jgi:hypothetical protein
MAEQAIDTKAPRAIGGTNATTKVAATVGPETSTTNKANLKSSVLPTPNRRRESYEVDFPHKTDGPLKSKVKGRNDSASIGKISDAGHYGSDGD